MGVRTGPDRPTEPADGGLYLSVLLTGMLFALLVGVVPGGVLVSVVAR
jgi:hypothetical protein